MIKPMRLRGKRAIVTGGSHGIGRAISQRLAAEGASLAIVALAEDRDELSTLMSELAQQQTLAISVTGDVADGALATRVVGDAVTQLGGLEILVNNVGGGGSWETFLEVSLAHLDRALATNIRGTFAFAQAAARVMEPGSAIVNMASSASTLGEENQAAYNAAKGGVAALTRSLAVDLAPRRIRVNAIAPGWVATRTTADYINDPASWNKHRTRIPFDRAGMPEEIASVCAFLVSDDASYVTGAIVPCDGGLTAGLRWSDWEAGGADE